MGCTTNDQQGASSYNVMEGWPGIGRQDLLQSPLQFRAAHLSCLINGTASQLKFGSRAVVMLIRPTFQEVISVLRNIRYGR